jgi:5-methylcytosine-specific restriction protein A
MLRIVKEKKETRACQKLLENKLRENLKSESKFKIGSLGGNSKFLVRYNSNMWFAWYEIIEDSPRFWNSFGLTSNLDQGKSNSIVVQINIPTESINRRVSGAFALDDKTEAVFLLHRGNIGGGRKGIGKNSFVNWYSKPLIDISNGTVIERAILIGEIGKEEFINDLSVFVQSVANFKLFATS